MESEEVNYQLIQRASKNFVIWNGILYRFLDRDHTKLRVEVPSAIQKSIVWLVHRAMGHVGVDKTVDLIKEKFVWDNLRVGVNREIRSCDTCQKGKYNSHLIREKPRPILPSKPNEIFATDLFGPLPKSKRGNQYISVTIDVFSKFTMLNPIQKATAKHVLMKLRGDVIPQMGKPVSLLSDHGSQYTSHEFRQALGNLGIKQILCSIRHPESNPAERVMSEIAKFCRLHISNDHGKWVDLLPFMMEIMNNTVHESTGQIPSIIHKGSRVPRPWDGIIQIPPEIEVSLEGKREAARKRLRKQAEKRARRLRHKRFRQPLVTGNLVAIRKPVPSDVRRKIYSKFAAAYVGPYRIQGTFENGSYKLSLKDQDEIVGVYNAASLKLYYERQ